jgi:hypothetical protein
MVLSEWCRWRGTGAKSSRYAALQKGWGTSILFHGLPRVVTEGSDDSARDIWGALPNLQTATRWKN